MLPSSDRLLLIPFQFARISVHAVSVHTDSQNAFFWTNTFILTKSQKLMFSYQKNLVFCNFFKVQSILTIHISGFRKINHFHLNLKYLHCVNEQRSIFLLIVSVCADFSLRVFYFSHESAGSGDPLYKKPLIFLQFQHEPKFHFHQIMHAMNQ